jgi:predicted MFS family arabinose efflux permease
MSQQLRPWLVLTGCFIVSLGGNAYAIAPASVAPLVGEAFAVRTTEVGLAISATVAGTVLLQIPGGLLLDRYDSRRLLGGAAGLFLLLAIAGLVPSGFQGFLVGRFLAGTASGFGFIAATSVVGGVFAAERQGLATSLFIASAPAGFVVGQAASPLLAGAFGWRAVFVTYPVVAVAGATLFLVVTSGPMRNDRRVSVGEFLDALRHRPVLVLAASSFAWYLLYIFLNSWLPTYATDVLALPLASAGALTALVPLTGIFARPIGGWAADRIGRNRPVIVFSLLGAIPGFAVILGARSAVAFAVALLAAGLLLQLSSGVYFVYVQELARRGTEGTSLTVFTSISFSAIIVSPILGGWLIDTVSWTWAFVIYGVLGVGGAGLVALLDG